MERCTQCGGIPMFNYEGHPLCLHCYSKIQQLNHQAVVDAMAMANYAMDEMETITGIRIPNSPRIKIPQQVTALHSGPVTMNNIKIDNSQIGFLNTGQIKGGVQNISVNISTLTNAGYKEVAQSIKAITEAAINSAELTTQQKTEALEHLEELTKQATLPADKRSKLSVIKAILVALGHTLEAAAGAAQVWSTWGPAICHYFSITI